MILPLVLVEFLRVSELPYLHLFLDIVWHRLRHCLIKLGVWVKADGTILSDCPYLDGK